MELNDPKKKCTHSKDGFCIFMTFADGGKIDCDGHDYKCVGHLVDEDEQN
jgi:hypothetical protein